MEKTFGSFLAEKRKEKNLTQEQLAVKLGKSQPAVANKIRLLKES